MTHNPFRGNPDSTLTDRIVLSRLDFVKKKLSELPMDILKQPVLNIGGDNLISQRLISDLGIALFNTTGDLNFTGWSPDLGSTGFVNPQFQCALYLEVLEHVQNPLLLLREIHRRVEPGAYLILTTPLVSWRFLQMPDHFIEYDEYRIRSLFDLADCWKIEELSLTRSQYIAAKWGTGFRPLCRYLFQKSFFIRARAI